MSTTFKNIVNRFSTTIKAASSINNTDEPVIFNITDDTGIAAAPFYITVEQLTDNTVFERMLVTDVTGDQLTATRAQDGSSKQTFAAGDLVQIRVIAAHIDEPTDAINILEDIKDYADSPMIITGGDITEGTNAGTFKVAALTALFRSTDSVTGELVELSLAEQDNQAITAADTTYFISLNYNDGVTPTISLSETIPYGPDAADYRNIPIGKVMKDGSDNVHFITGGFNFQDGVKKLHQRAIELRNVELQSGSTIAYSGTNNFTMETGTAYAGINRIVLAQYDSAVTQFTAVYQDGIGGWTEALSNVIDYEHYDDGTPPLGTIANNKYGCFWVYKHADDGDVYVLYGRDSYTLAGAEDAQEPTKPTHLTDFGLLVGKIIAPQAGGSFTVVQMVTDTIFTGTAASDHGNLTGLTDSDDHTQYALLLGRAGGQTIIGGTGSGDDLTLQSSSDATKGYIHLGIAKTSYFDEVNENLIITGDIGLTGTRVTKGWFTDLEITNLPTINGGTLATALGLGTMAGETATDYALVDQTMYIGTTAVDIDRGSATLNLAGIGTLGCGAITSTGIVRGTRCWSIIVGDSQVSALLARSYFANISYSNGLSFYKSHSNTEAYVETPDNSQLGIINAHGVGSDADTWDMGTSIVFEQDGSAAANYIPGRIVFKTGSTTANPATALTLDSSQNATFAGDVNPDGDGTRDLGTQTTAQWANVWADLVNGSDYSMLNGWRILESEKYNGYPKGIAIGKDGFNDGIITDKMPNDIKPIFVITEDFIEYKGIRITSEMLKKLI